MDYALRAATPADAETIYRFVFELATYEREPDAVKVTPDVLRAQLSEAAPPFECLLAEAAGEPVGMALFFHNYSTWRGRRGLYLEDLYVTPAYRRRGVATGLLKALAALARDRGCARLEWAVLDWNAPAVAFYRALGATALDAWTVFRLADDALLRLAEG